MCIIPLYYRRSETVKGNFINCAKFRTDAVGAVIRQEVLRKQLERL